MACCRVCSLMLFLFINRFDHLNRKHILYNTMINSVRSGISGHLMVLYNKKNTILSKVGLVAFQLGKCVYRLHKLTMETCRRVSTHNSLKTTC